MPSFSGVQFDPILNHLKFYDANNKGWYATEAALNSAWPTATAGSYAVVGATDTVWVWDTDTVAWINSSASGTVTSFNGRTGVVTPLAGDYTFAMIGLNLADTQLPVSGNWDLTGNLIIRDDEVTPNTLFSIDEANKRIGIGTNTPLASLHINGGVGSLVTGLAFGDGDTGFHENTDDDLYLSIATSAKWRFNATKLGSIATTGAILSYSGSDYTIPSLIPRSGDTNTGIGSGSPDQLSLIAGGVEVIRLVENTTIQVILPLQNNALTPIFAFGVGDTGFYEEADDELRLAFAGSQKWLWNSSGLTAITSGAASIRNEVSSSTNPVFAFNGDFGTGLGRPGASQLSLTTGSVEAIRIDSSQNVGLGIVPLAKLHINGGVGSLSTGLAFGDGDSGLYESADDSIWMTLSSAVHYKFNQNYFQLGASGGYPGIMKEIASGVNPVFVPVRDDPDTGVGSAALDQLSLIAGGVEGIRIEESANAISIGLYGVTAVTQAAHIIDADGTLSDLTTKFNTLLSDIENIGILASA